MSDSLAISLNLARKAPSQYTNQPFTSIIEMNGEPLFLGPGGVYVEGGNDDDGTEIDAWVDTPILDLGNRQQKTIEAFDVGYEAEDNLTLTLVGDEDEGKAREFVLAPVKSEQVQQDGMQTLRRYKYGAARYWRVRVANQHGGDFSLDFLALAPVFLKRRSL